MRPGCVLNLYNRTEGLRLILRDDCLDNFAEMLPTVYQCWRVVFSIKMIEQHDSGKVSVYFMSSQRWLDDDKCKFHWSIKKYV